MSEQKTPRELLKEKGQLEKDIVAVKVGKEVFDLHTPIDVKSEMSPVRASEPLGLEVIRHSTAHVMADAVQRLFPGTKVTFGPATEDGFYYDFAKPGGGFTEDDLRKIEEAMVGIIKHDSIFRREVVSRDDAVRLFEKMGESFKVEHISRIPENEPISLYRHGGKHGDADWVDLCAGPHVPSTGFLKAVKLTHVAGAYWRGDERNPMLQRIYGTAFASKEALEEHLRMIEEAKQRDHRKLGKELELFMFHEYAPAMPFLLPKGAFVYNQLTEYIRDRYLREGYEEVITPQIFDKRLFETSGHWDNYLDNMYLAVTADRIEEFFQGNKEKAGQVLSEAYAKGGTNEIVSMLHALAQKPMNCPSHCLIYKHRRRSYRELPWRVADFCRLHRYERGGVVHGMARVRSFSQDDAHIFCAPADMESEIARFLKFFFAVYHALKFEKIDIKLATRPERRIGTDAQWDAAEAALEQALKRENLPFEFSPGEGAFYGPKYEFHVQDALKRSWQLGTLQIDYALPDRFELEFTATDGSAQRPVMLHRAIYGSLERFFSVYLEHCGGNFPTWISPRQAIVLTVSDKADDYAKSVHQQLSMRGFRVDLDVSADKLGAKIRNARLQRYPYLLVVGAKEAETNAVGVRSREKGELGAMPVDQFTTLLASEAAYPAE